MEEDVDERIEPIEAFDDHKAKNLKNMIKIFVFEVYDGGNVDWDELMPGKVEFEDYESLGTYLSDIVAKNNGYTIENLENGTYRVEID